MRLYGSGGGNRTHVRAFRERCPTIERHRNMYGRGRGIRTLTERILSPVPLPLGYAPIKAYWGQGATPESN